MSNIIILSQNKNEIINTENIENINMQEREFIDYEEKKQQWYCIFTGKGFIGKYKTENRAQEILLDIYSKLVENKNNYRMPEE